MERPREIEPGAAREFLDRAAAVFVDIRDPASFRESRIPGAIQLDEATIGPFLEAADPARPVVVYCYHGISSLSAAAWLAERGLAEVYSLSGGFEGWRWAQPCEEGDAPAR